VIDLHLEPVRECIYDRCTYAVKTAGYFVSAAAEFSAGMKNRKYYLNSRNSCFVVNTNRDSSSLK
jgi:hypothetical protein